MRTANISWLVLLFAALSGLGRASAQQLLANGAVVSGTVTDGETAEWDFSGAKPDQEICVSITTPSSNRMFDPGEALDTDRSFVGGLLGDRRCTHTGTAVPSRIFVKNLASYDPKKPMTHNYTIQLAIPDEPFDPSNGGQEAVIGAVYNVTNVSHNVDIWRFSAVAGEIIKIKAYHPNSGGLSGYSPWIFITYPDGTTFKAFESGADGVATAPFSVSESGTYVVFVYNNTTINANSYPYTFSVAGSSAPSVSIALSRTGLTSVTASGLPLSPAGKFSYATTRLGGQTITSPVSTKGSNAMSNPNPIGLTDPPNPTKLVTPYPGGLASITATYSVEEKSATDQFSVPTFGVSCYTTSLETDWGTAPNQCKSRKYYGETVFGSVVNPAGLNGTFCNVFIRDAELQGSAILADGTILHFDNTTKVFSIATEILTSQGTVPVANKTVAKDETIIPGKTILVDVDQVGTGLMATDSFGRKHKGYRLDLYGGLGETACKKYRNPISVSACTPATALCPSRDIY